MEEERLRQEVKQEIETSGTFSGFIFQRWLVEPSIQVQERPRDTIAPGNFFERPDIIAITDHPHGDFPIYIIVELKTEKEGGLNKKSFGQVLLYSWALLLEESVLKVEGETIEPPEEYAIQPAIGFTTAKQAYFVDFRDFLNEKIIEHIQVPINKIYLSHVTH